jgi:hypothetical protein
MSVKDGRVLPVSRRSVLQGTAAAAAGAAGLVVAPASLEAAPKKTLQQVAYQSSPKGSQRCDNCGLFIKPNRCRSVAGTVAPQGWCKIWTD